MNERRAKAAPTAPSLPKNRAVVISTTAIGTALILVMIWLLLVPMPERLDTERAFRAAKDCAPGAVATDCLHSVPAVIERTREKNGKAHAHWMYVKTAEGNTPTLYFKGASGTRSTGWPGSGSASRTGRARSGTSTGRTPAGTRPQTRAAPTGSSWPGAWPWGRQAWA